MSALDQYLKEHSEEAYRAAMADTVYDADGHAMITKDAEWASETEWDEMFRDITKTSRY